MVGPDKISYTVPPSMGKACSDTDIIYLVYTGLKLVLENDERSQDT